MNKETPLPLAYIPLPALDVFCNMSTVQRYLATIDTFDSIAMAIQMLIHATIDLKKRLEKLESKNGT